MSRLEPPTRRTEPREPLREGAPTTSRWSWRIGALAGIPVYVHATFLLLLAWVSLSHAARGGGFAGVASGMLLVVLMFACVVVHELSHALVARRFGVRTREITLLPIGGVAQLERMPEEPRQELLVAAAGPATSLALAAALFVLVVLLGQPIGPEGLRVVGGAFLAKLMWFNVTLAIFNLLPAFPMDGGRVLRALLATRMDRTRATEVAARVGQGMALLFGLLGFFYNPILLFIGVFVWMGAKGEVTLAQLRAALYGMTVSQAMVTDFHVLSPGDTLARAAALMLAGFQQDFPVMEGGAVVGVLTRADLVKAMAQGGTETLIEVAMQRRFETARPSEMLEVAIERLQQSECRALIVVHNGQVVGLLTPENIGEMITMEQALRASRLHPR